MASDIKIPVHPYRWTAGDRKPRITGAFTGSAGLAVDITGYTITAKLRRPSGAPLLKTLTTAITNAAGGLWEIQWAVGDLVEGFSQLIEIEIDDGTGEIETQRLLIDVTENIG